MKMEIIKKIVIFDRIYGVFNLGDLFSFRKGNGSSSDEGIYPQVSAAKYNNGVSGKSNSWIAENCFTIAAAGNGACGACYWHPYKFDAISTADIATPKFKLGDFVTMSGLAAYISSYLRYKRYDFGRGASLWRLEKQVIALPIIKDEIDWEFIHNSYKTSVSKIYNRKKDILVKKIEALNVEFESPEFYSEVLDKKVIFDRIYGIFNLKDLFNLVKGKAGKLDEGDYPLITAAAKNNGIAGKTNTSTFENCFTISGDGACGDCYYHPYKFDVYVNATAGVPKFKLGDFVTMSGLAAYISSYLKYKRFSYGRKSGLGRLENQVIALPIIKDKIDWQFIYDTYKASTSRIYNKKLTRLQGKIDALDVEFIKPEFN
jgi:uncharacterized membrane protein